jgi:hypothetical protein
VQLYINAYNVLILHFVPYAKMDPMVLTVHFVILEIINIMELANLVLLLILTAHHVIIILDAVYVVQLLRFILLQIVVAKVHNIYTITNASHAKTASHIAHPAQTQIHVPLVLRI